MIHNYLGRMSSSGSQQSGSGLMSSAGLVRYFDAEEEKVAFDPRTILAVGAFVGMGLIVLNLVIMNGVL